MPGPTKSPYEQPSVENWYYTCRRCNVEGYGRKDCVCWMCDQADELEASSVATPAALTEGS